jgi:hypothetical protein
MIVSSPSEFARAVAAHPFEDYDFDSNTLERAAASVADAGLLVVGELHGVRETPSVLYALARALGTRAVAFEWSHEEMDEPVQLLLQNGAFDFERLWSLPASAELWCGDGRIAAGHFALLQRLRDEGRLDQVITYDRLDPEPPPDDWRVRDREMAERLLAEWDEQLPLLVLTGAFHARLGPGDGETMAAHLSLQRTGVSAAVLEYASGQCWWRGEARAVSASALVAPITLRLPVATPAVVPGRAGA